MILNRTIKKYSQDGKFYVLHITPQKTKNKNRVVENKFSGWGKGEIYVEHWP